MTLKEVDELHQLKALPICVCVRTKDGGFRSRNEDGDWFQMGVGHEEGVTWTEDDLPAKVVWTYAEEIGVPEVEALARLATVMIQQQAEAQVVGRLQAAQQQAAQIVEEAQQKEAQGQQPVNSDTPSQPAPAENQQTNAPLAK